jgi:uncharacterized protein (DUF1778 family)
MPENTNRTQVNFRIDTELLEAIKQAAAERGISYTQLILDACKAELGREVTDTKASTNSNGLKELKARIAELEQRLAERIVREKSLVENDLRLAERIDKVESELGKSAA